MLHYLSFLCNDVGLIARLKYCFLSLSVVKFWLVSAFILINTSLYALTDSLERLPAKVMAELVDSALQAANMTSDDLWLPSDVLSLDSFRLPVVTDLFKQPLMSSAFVAAHNKAIEGGVKTYTPFILKTLNSSTGSVSIQIPANQKNFKSLFRNMPEALIPVLVTWLEYSKKVKKWRGNINLDDYNTVLRQAETLLLYSGESKDLDVFSLKQAEVTERQEAREFFRAAANINVDDVIVLALAYFKSLNGFLKDSAGMGCVVVQNTMEWDTPFGLVALGGSGPDIYNKPYAFILDCGGDDVYLLPPQKSAEAMNIPLRVVIDLGGSDKYISGDYSLGGGFFGISILVDKAGDDTYSSGNFSQGSGFFGAGILRDDGGNDSYTSRVCTQGSGAFGFGLLIDSAGNDVYVCQGQAQGFGFTAGYGALLDHSGNDNYIASSPYQDFLRYESHFLTFTQGAGLGYRPLASGGVGVLWDASGNDNYVSDIYGQGTSYWYALGVLIDNGGDDTYKAYQYAQGAGVHLAHGLLWDASGNDSYNSHGVSLGCGHDLATGLLVDLEGDDNYRAYGLSMGGGNANAVSILADVKGNDSYTGRTLNNMLGYSDLRRDYGMVGVFVDGGGGDKHGRFISDNSIYTKSTYGVFADFNIYPDLKQVVTVPELTPPDSEKISLALSLDSLFIQASAAAQKFQYNVGPARDSIIARGAAALPFLGSKMNTEFARESHALRYLLENNYEKLPSLISSFLADSVKSDNKFTRSMAADICGRKKCTQCLPPLHSLAGDSNWNVRALAVWNIGKIGNLSSLDTLVYFLGDPHPHVIMRAAYGVGFIFPDNIIDHFPIILDHKLQIVRNSFIQGIIKNGKPLDIKFISRGMAILRTERGKRALTQLLTQLPEEKSTRSFLKKFIKKMPFNIRQSAYTGIRSQKGAFWHETLGYLLKNEKSAKFKYLLSDFYPGEKDKP